MDAVLAYFADSASEYNNRVPLTRPAPLPGSDRFESRYSVRERTGLGDDTAGC